MKILLFSLFFFNCSMLESERPTESPFLPHKLSGPLPKKKIAALTFFNDSKTRDPHLEETASQQWRRLLTSSGKFIVDPQASHFGHSREIYARGGIRETILAKKWNPIDLHLISFGRITKAEIKEQSTPIGLIRKTYFKIKVNIEVRLFDVHKNKEVYADQATIQHTSSKFHFFSLTQRERSRPRQRSLHKAVQAAVFKAFPPLLKMAGKLDWVGRVAKVIGPKIYINSGKRSGLYIGDILKVSTKGEEIVAPDTGEVIGFSKGRHKGTLEVIDYFGLDGTIAILHSGGLILEGDLVRPY